jgi:hypothetical protein
MSRTEHEGPPVSAPKRRGFGTIVMESMAERSVNGKVDLDYAPSGLTWRLTCPAADALEPREREQISGEGANLSGEGANRSGGTNGSVVYPPPALAGDGKESGARHSPQFNTEMRGR